MYPIAGVRGIRCRSWSRCGRYGDWRAVREALWEAHSGRWDHHHHWLHGLRRKSWCNKRSLVTQTLREEQRRTPWRVSAQRLRFRGHLQARRSLSSRSSSQAKFEIRETAIEGCHDCSGRDQHLGQGGAYLWGPRRLLGDLLLTLRSYGSHHILYSPALPLGEW